MCLMCQEEDLYFLYLEQRERERRRERGETNAANPNWLWPSFVAAPSDAGAPGETSAQRSAPSFTCDPAE